MLDDFTSGAATLTGSGSWEFAATNAFGGNRRVVLLPLSSSTSVTIGSGSLTWHQTMYSEYVFFTDYSGFAISLEYDLSHYDALQFTVVSAPSNAGQLLIEVNFRTSSYSSKTVSINADVPASGVVIVPYSAFIASGGGNIDFAHVLGVGLKLGGNILAPGTYVIKDLKAINLNGPAQLANPSLKAGGIFSFNLQGTVGSNYVVEVSNDLTTWSPLSTNTIPNQGNLTLDDVTAPASAVRFYRATKR